MIQQTQCDSCGSEATVHYPHREEDLCPQCAKNNAIYDSFDELVTESALNLVANLAEHGLELGLAEKDIEFILSGFHKGSTYQERLALTLRDGLDPVERLRRNDYEEFQRVYGHE